MPGNKKEYNSNDFSRYYRNEMTEAERHALERAALEDPFLADALDGYAASNDPVAEMEEIRKRFSGQRKKKASGVIPNLLKAAAIIIIATGIYWLVQPG